MESGATTTTSESYPPERHHVHYYLIIIAMVSILFTFIMACTVMRTYTKQEENRQPQQQSTPNQLESGSVRHNDSIAVDPPPAYSREPQPEQPSVLTCPEMTQIPPPPSVEAPDCTLLPGTTIVPGANVGLQHRPPSYDEY